MLARNLTQGIREARTVGYLPGNWRDFGVTVAGLPGALTGLLFVAVSIKSAWPVTSCELPQHDYRRARRHSRA